VSTTGFSSLMHVRENTRLRSTTWFRFKQLTRNRTLREYTDRRGDWRCCSGDHAASYFGVDRSDVTSTARSNGSFQNERQCSTQEPSPR
jgi:hypothetical protein